MMNDDRACLVWVLAVAAAGLLVLAFGLPLLKMRVEAPRTGNPDSVSLAVYPASIRGDGAGAGMTSIPQVLPLHHWLPWVFTAGGTLAMASALVRSRWQTAGLLAAPLTLLAGCVLATIAASNQIHQFNGIVDLSFGSGVILAGMAVALQSAAAWMSRAGFVGSAGS